MLAFVWRTAIQKGLFGGNRTWMTVFAVIGVAKAMRRVSGATPDKVFEERLAPGEALLITHLAHEKHGD